MLGVDAHYNILIIYSPSLVAVEAVTLLDCESALVLVPVPVTQNSNPIGKYVY